MKENDLIALLSGSKVTEGLSTHLTSFSLMCTHRCCIFSFTLHTYWSSHHIIHEGSQTPPVDSSIVTRPGQDLRSPGRAKNNPTKGDFKIGACIMSVNSRCLYYEGTRTYMYSMVPQKVCVTAPSWMDSLQRPKSVNLMCPIKKGYNSFFYFFYFSKIFYIWVRCVTLMIEHDVFRF